MRIINSKIRGIIVLILMVWIASCSEPLSDTNPNFTPAFGEAHLNLNGETIDVLPYAHISNWNDTTFNLALLEVDDNFFVKSQLSISNIPHIIDSHPIIIGTSSTTEGPGALFNTYRELGHVGGDLFRYQKELDYSYVKLITLDTNTNEVAGEFKIQLIRVLKTNSSPELPDTLNVSGNFSTRIDTI